MAHASWYAQPLLESQHDAVVTMMKEEGKRERWVGGHGGQSQETRLPYPSPPMSDGGGCDEQDELDSVCPSRSRGARVYPKTPYPSSSSSMVTQESLHGERHMVDDTTFQPSSTITTGALVNETTHPHTHVHELITAPAPFPFSIRQTFSAYPNIDLFDESLRQHRNYYSVHNLAQEVAEKIPERGSRGVSLQDPANLLQRRLSERRRQQRKLDFSKTVLVYGYDPGCKDMPMRPESTIFHDDDGESGDAGPWPRNKFTSRNSEMDSKFYWQAYGHEASMRRLRYDSEKKDYVWTTLEEAKDLSGKEERMREKAKAQREEEVREGAEVAEG
ncbi:MAG: hypothetical protein ASARMPRED_006503 [Alectoria sarmentosa]|nr:MAG: hypothetical protein ASARMPRED_006503 [Alectoria sarmentosa]